MKDTKSRFSIMKTVLGLSVMGDSIWYFHGTDAEIINYHKLLTSWTVEFLGFLASMLPFNNSSALQLIRLYFRAQMTTHCSISVHGEDCDTSCAGSDTHFQKFFRKMHLRDFLATSAIFALSRPYSFLFPEFILSALNLQSYCKFITMYN